jgi:hypothetical protein
MSLGKLNYDSLQEEFCILYHQLYGKLPDKSTRFSKPNLIKKIWSLKRSIKVIDENSSYYLNN